ncbi:MULTISPECIES: HK97 gp10 family phage protein [unclassified Enterococcus]|uniref:HK97 gp10 family phage protein n=1 Tax=unclassified Enterococcus TaxID=2608891 RepID=UPI0015522BBA|nr:MULTISPECIES: HK97 gp10 family phage protein [unclassified Enterococcus]MBS7578294.1 HK97 gp10 family phage protein [Enterococcus sp. MMGLQ5-2]MBS7585495.1 HK97 gp10 family phage protein [Enterococcus sp. MMGLQ5-1]NPD13352.1 hypothetical protein [Enterococcus sp. MMGLQ5-1]NPD38125.1 hypothetical protein [Enterococcus sp. MMGLQ5-2]
MSVSIKGTDQILRNIESKLGKNKANRVINKALRNTGDEIVDIVKDSVAYYRDTGATYNEVVKSGVKGASSGIKTVEVGWRGDQSRWRLVHLNEFGYTRFGQYVRPQGMGAVQKAADKSQDIAFKNMKKDLEELAK